MSWSGPFELVTAEGDALRRESLGALLVDAKSAPEAAARLVAYGVDLTAIGPVSVTATTNVGVIVGGIADMKAGETSYDVLVLDNGLILAETTRETEYGGKRRLDRLANSGSVAKIATRHRFVPYWSVASAKIPAGSPSRQRSHCATAPNYAKGADGLGSTQ